MTENLRGRMKINQIGLTRLIWCGRGWWHWSWKTNASCSSRPIVLALPSVTVLLTVCKGITSMLSYIDNIIV